MSGRDFNFAKPRPKVIPGKENDQSGGPVPKITATTSTLILNQFDRYQKLLTSDTELRESKELQEKMSDEITVAMQELQSYKDNPNEAEILLLNDKLNHLSERH